MTVIIKLTLWIRALMGYRAICSKTVVGHCPGFDDKDRPEILPIFQGDGNQNHHEPWTREVWGLPLFPSLLSRPRWSRSFSRFVPLRSSWSFGFRVGLWFGL